MPDWRTEEDERINKLLEEHTEDTLIGRFRDVCTQERIMVKQRIAILEKGDTPSRWDNEHIHLIRVEKSKLKEKMKELGIVLNQKQDAPQQVDVVKKLEELREAERSSLEKAGDDEELKKRITSYFKARMLKLFPEDGSLQNDGIGDDDDF
jgi:hypothetical protein